MKELVVLSGKGGTGKTSLTAAFATLAGRVVVADCDVDAANLHLLLAPILRETGEFQGGKEAIIRTRDCTACGLCATLCRFGSVRESEGKFAISHCEGCGVCVEFCPQHAIDWVPAMTGTWMVSDCPTGRMAHAHLRPGAENSGKLAAFVRKLAKEQATETGSDLVLVDGPPGIGCPVIASLTGADAALIVTEPTPSGIHDMERILDLTRHFGVDTRVVINKFDINLEKTQRIRDLVSGRGLGWVGTLPYSPLFTQAQVEGKPIPLAFPDAEITERIRLIWKETKTWIER
ncbi:MAG: ATP-binding protein [Fibrobacterota bacterium]|nr:ATP-binding protein [Fibrobacterota bacterium]QQS04839.1 MAG: ATP-binding protein [Fibrobacterota bacterium]